MSYKLEYPYTDEQRENFVVEYNHQQGLRIETVDNFIEEEIITEAIIDIETEEVIQEATSEMTTKNYPTYYALEVNEIMLDGEPVIDEDYEAKQAQAERERIAMLKLTKREVFLGLYQAKGVTPEQIKAQITDPAALIEFEYANDYFRGNPLIDIVGGALGITPEQLDKFFEFNDWIYLKSDVGETA